MRGEETIATRSATTTSRLASIAFFETSHARLLLFPGELAAGKWDGYMRAWGRGSAWHHFEEHGARIRTWRECVTARSRPGVCLHMRHAS